MADVPQEGVGLFESRLVIISDTISAITPDTNYGVMFDSRPDVPNFRNYAKLCQILDIMFDTMSDVTCLMADVPQNAVDLFEGHHRHRHHRLRPSSDQ